MTPEICTTDCSTRGFTYAATEYGVECYCGNRLKKTFGGAGNLVNNQECDVPCDGVLHLILLLICELARLRAA